MTRLVVIDTEVTTADFAGTAFGTDPNYVQTNATFIAYQNLVTC